MKTLDELLRRFRNAPGTTRDEKIASVVDTVAENPEEAVQYWRMLGPWALRELDRRYMRDTRLVAVGNSGVHKPMDALTRADFIEARGFLAAMHGSLGKVIRAMNKTVRAYRNERETFGDVRKRLDPETLQTLSAWRGPKLLGGGEQAA